MLLIVFNKSAVGRTMHIEWAKSEQIKTSPENGAFQQDVPGRSNSDSFLRMGFRELQNYSGLSSACLAIGFHSYCSYKGLVFKATLELGEQGDWISVG